MLGGAGAGYGVVADTMAKPAARQGADRARSRPAGKGPALACSGRLRARGARTWCGVERCRGFPFWEFRIAQVPPAGARRRRRRLRGRRRHDGQTRSTARGRSSSLAPRWKRARVSLLWSPPRARGADLVRRRALSRISFLGIPDRPGAARWCSAAPAPVTGSSPTRWPNPQHGKGSMKSPIPKGRLRVSNWIVQRRYDYAVNETFEL